MNTTKVIFTGQAESVILPGDMGTFEIMSYHKRVLSRLLKGNIEVGGAVFPIMRGIARAEKNNVLIIAEEE